MYMTQLQLQGINKPANGLAFQGKPREFHTRRGGGGGPGGRHEGGRGGGRGVPARQRAQSRKGRARAAERERGAEETLQLTLSTRDLGLLVVPARCTLLAAAG